LPSKITYLPNGAGALGYFVVFWGNNDFYSYTNINIFFLVKCGIAREFTDAAD